MTEQQIDRERLRRLADAATEGPWDYPGTLLGLSCTTVFAGRTHAAYVAAASPENGAFIAAARTAVPQLLDQLDQAEAIIRRQERYIEGLEGTDAVGLEARAEKAEARIQAVREVLAHHPYGGPGQEDAIRRALDSPDGSPARDCGRGPCCLGHGHAGDCKL